MKKRHFLGALAGGGAALPLAGLSQPAKLSKAASPTLLTVTGNITKTNRGPLDAVLDQMMAKQKLAFDKARGFTFAELAGLGPLWAVYEADSFPEMAVKPVDQRFAQCPWGLYHIDVQA